MQFLSEAYKVDSETWSTSDLKKWLREVLFFFSWLADDQRDIHYEAAELRDDLVKRVQEAMDVNDRRQEQEVEERTGNTAMTQTQEIEMDDLTNSTGKVISK